MLRLYLTILPSELRFELTNFFISAMRSPEKIWSPHINSIHFEIFQLLRAFAVKSCSIFGEWNKFAFELRCGPRSLFEVSKLCEVDYQYFGTQTQTN